MWNQEFRDGVIGFQRGEKEGKDGTNNCLADMKNGLEHTGFKF